MVFNYSDQKDMPKLLMPLITEATLDDLPAILELYADAGIDSGHQLPLVEAQTIFRRLRSYPDYKIYVARDEHRIAGSFALLIMDNLGHQGTPAGVVEAVAVRPQAQRKGIGKAMMEFAKTRCREAGCYKLALSSNIKRTHAHDFYKYLGFEQHGYSFHVEIKGTDQ